MNRTTCAQRINARQDAIYRKVDALAARPKFYACGICDHLHPITWDGDCRDDANRFTNAALDDLYGAEVWVEVEMPV